MNRHEHDPSTAGTPDAHDGQGTPLVSRVRAGANVAFLVAGLLFLLGFLLTIALSGTLDEPHMRLLTDGTAYAGFIAGVAFITSFISIIVENRTVPHTEEEEA